MKKLLQMKTMLLLCALIVGSGSVWADTSTLTFTAACGGSGTADDGVIVPLATMLLNFIRMLFASGTPCFG